MELICVVVRLLVCNVVSPSSRMVPTDGNLRPGLSLDGRRRQVNWELKRTQVALKTSDFRVALGGHDRRRRESQRRDAKCPPVVPCQLG